MGKSSIHDNLSSQLIEQIDRAVLIMKNGGIVAFPTDTVYGLGADAFNSEAVERIYKVKRRPRYLSLPVLLADVAQVSMVASSVSEIARVLMNKFWPGGLTLVLPKADSFQSDITGGGSSIAVRIPNHIVPLTIIRKLGAPVIGTSANISNKPSATIAQEVAVQLGNDVDLVVDGSRCPGGLESTVVDVTGEAFVILRKGIVSESDVRKVCEKYAEKVAKK